MRVISGKFRGRKLAKIHQDCRQSFLRPTSDRIKESLFNILTNGVLGDVVAGARVLDLFSGTGALGLEAFSRGANCVTLIDNSRVASDVISKNISLLGRPKDIMFRQFDALNLPPNATKRFTLVFADPPYGKGLCPLALSSAKKNAWLDTCATILCEDNIPILAPKGFQLIDTRKFGMTYITLLRQSN